MKNLKFVFLTLFTLVFSLSNQAQDFEGTIKLTSDSPYGLNADLKVKDGKVVMEQASKKGSLKIIFNNDQGDMIVLTEEGGKKMAVKNNLNDNPYLQQFNQKQAAKSTSDFKYEITDETAVVNGYNCVKIIGKDSETEGYAWVTKDLNIGFSNLIPAKQMQNTGRNPWSTQFGEEGMMMQMHVKELKTGKEWTMNAEVEEKAIAASEFEIPADYQVMDMTNMRQLMMDAQKDPDKMRQLKEMMQNMQN